MSASQWAAQEFPAMWLSAQAADTLMAWRQVHSWRRTYELLQHYEKLLRTCRTELTAAWPPERSPAATAFVDYIDGLLVSIGDAKEDALANGRGLFGVLSSLSATKADMAKLKAKWDEYEAEEKTRFQNLTNTLPHSAGNDWRSVLNEHARTRMTQNDKEVFEATRQMMVPTTVDTGRYPGTPFDPGSTGGPGVGSARRSGAAGARGDGWMRAPTIPSVSDLDGSAGLAGSSAPPVSTPTVPGGSGPAPGQPGAPGGSAVLPPPVMPVGRPPIGGAHGTVGFPPGTSRPTPAVGLRPGANVGHGGVIGGRSPAVAPPLSHGVAGPGTGGRRVNPVGGVVGGHGGAGPAGIPIAGAGRGGGERRRLRPERDPYNVWAVDEGVPPVIEPPPERPHDPGLGVFGIDR